MSYKNPEKRKEYRKKRRDLIIQNLHELKLTLSCKECGESNFTCLDFHHKDPSQKDFSISDAIRNRLSYKRILEEIEKCDVLCSNCHRKLHYSMRTGENENNIRNTNMFKMSISEKRARYKERKI